jgi:hypothetical protein
MGNSNSFEQEQTDNPMIQKQIDEKIFDTVAQGFKDEITLVKNKMARNDPPFSRRLENEASYCCNESEKTILLDFAIKIKQVLPNYSFKDICIAVIYTYYGLVLNEIVYFFNIKPVKKDYRGNPNIQQTTIEKRFNFWINQFSDNIKNVYTLFLRLGAPNEKPPSTNYIHPPGDEDFTDDENEPQIFYPEIVNPGTKENLSEQFRQSVLGMKQKRKRIEGGKPKRKSKTKKPKPKKTKRKKRTTSRKP